MRRALATFLVASYWARSGHAQGMDPHGLELGPRGVDAAPAVSVRGAGREAA